METINAEVLCFLLKIEKADANKKIVAYLERKKGNSENVIQAVIGKGENATHSDNEVADVEGLEKYLNIDLKWAIKNIQDTYLTSPITRAWIMNFPQSKLIVNKATRKMPKSVTIPKALAYILSQQDKKKIIQMWEDKYYTTVAADPVNDVRFKIK